MYLTYVCIVIALVFVASSDAFPYSSSSILIDSRSARREIFDPYGFNSILTRFVKRNQLYDIRTKRTIDLIDQNEYDYI